MRGCLFGRWVVGGSEVRERGCGRVGGEAELVDLEEGRVGVLKVGVESVGALEGPWVWACQLLLLKALGA